MQLVARLVVVLVVVGAGLVGGPAPGLAGRAEAADTGPWDWPLDGPPPVVGAFAPPATPYGSGHRGVDLRAAPGAVVRAAGAGVVGYAGLLAGRGVVTVVHGALRTTYEPVTASVAVGQAVALGEELGVLEPGGHCSGGCLHWGLRRGEQYLDPLSLVAGPVRLLPLGGPVPVPAAAVRAGTPGGPAGSVGLRADDRAGDPAPADTTPLPAVAADGGWDLRVADAPLGAAALAALVAGVALLARPRPRPRPDDPAPAATPAAAGPIEPEPVGAPGDVLDLDAARLRRRTAS